MASNITDIGKIIQQQLSGYVPDNDQIRQQLLRSARSLVASLEKPEERVARMCYADLETYATTRLLIELKVFTNLTASKNAMSATQLAKPSGADPELMKRLLKHVAAENLVQETGPDEYTANDLTRCIASAPAAGAIKDCFTMFQLQANQLAYFKETGYANPSNKDRTLFKKAFNTEQHYFEYIHSPGREDMLENFYQHMAVKTLGPKWFDSDEIMSDLFGNVKLSDRDVLLVDVGGANGHDITAFHKAHSKMSGRLILQDLPSMIDNIDTISLSSNDIEAIAHDFFTPQPVQHAKAYYLKMVLHDWPTEQCKQILSNLKPAMKAGYSRVLLNEIVIPDVDAGWFETSLDLLMMKVHAAQERRENEWRELIESVEGLKVRKIWDVPGAVEKVIEIELE